MPTYDYVCDACEHKFELFQSIMDKPKRKCSKCGKSKLRRLFGTGAAVVFKGSGFYQTDYRSESYKKAASADASAKEGKSDGKSDTKAESKKSGSDNGTPKSHSPQSDKKGSGK